MSTQKEEILSLEETEILQEIMNIAFGQSAADLTSVIDTQVILSVPFIEIMNIADLPGYFKNHVKDHKNISLVEQKFWGRFSGDALLLFSSGAGKELISLLENDDTSFSGTDPLDILERETLMEVGNILIGACVGKISELLKDVVTYNPPLVVVEKGCHEAIADHKYNPNSTAIVMKTDFRFDERDISGFLFLVTSNDSVEWLRDALRLFIEQYE
jgi:chemotaxis protein CheC